MSKKIGIVGPKGNVGNAFINAFTNYSNEFGAEDIYPITRDYFDSDIRSGLRDINLKEMDMVILAVKPKDAIQALSLMRGEISPYTLIISPVSGLSINVIGDMLRIKQDRIVKITLNTNIEYSNGIVIYNTASKSVGRQVEEIFSSFCKAVIEKPGRKITPAITTVGSGNAFFAKLILLRYEQFSDIPFVEFIKGISMNDIFIEKYIDAVEKASRKLFNDDSLIRIGSESTLHALRKSCTSKDDVKLHIEKVATKGGCTRVGIDDFDTLEKVTEEFFTPTFAKVHKKAKSFQRLINGDFKKWKEFNSIKRITKSPDGYCQPLW